VPDITLYRASAAHFPDDMLNYEIIGDRGYEQSDCTELLAKVRRTPAWFSPDDRVVLRTWHSVLERGRVLCENNFSRLADFKLIGNKFRGQLHRHALYVFLAASITQLQLIMSPLRDAQRCEAHQCIFDQDAQRTLATLFLNQFAQTEQ
jgi:hypothetical protein